MFNFSQLTEIAMPAPVTSDDCYFNFNKTISPNLLEYITNFVNSKNLKFWNRSDSRSFWQLQIDTASIRGLDSTLDNVIHEFGNISISLLYTQPWTYIHPHKDKYRKCAMNAVLTESPSTTFWLTGNRRTDQDHIIELDFKLNNYYLLNTSIMHGVINRNNPRLSFSMDFSIDVDYNFIQKKFIN